MSSDRELSKRLTRARTREAVSMSSLYEIPSSVIVVCLFGVLMLMADIGFRFGRRTRAKLTDTTARISARSRAPSCG